MALGSLLLELVFDYVFEIDIPAFEAAVMQIPTRFFGLQLVENLLFLG